MKDYGKSGLASPLFLITVIRKIRKEKGPGLGRTLKKDKHLAKSIGEEVEIKTYKPIDKQKEFRGILKAFDAETITLATEKDEQVFARNEIALIRLAFYF